MKTKKDTLLIAKEISSSLEGLTIRQAKSVIDWLQKSIAKSEGDTKYNPLAINYYLEDIHKQGNKFNAVL